MTQMHEPVDAAQAYYTTAYAPRTGTTSTPTLRMWRALSDNLLENLAPLTGADLAARTHLTLKEIETYFGQEYYRRSYGFLRFNSLDDWTAWAEGHGLLYVPGMHDAEPEPDDDEADEVDED